MQTTGTLPETPAWRPSPAGSEGALLALLALLALRALRLGSAARRPRTALTCCPTAHPRGRPRNYSPRGGRPENRDPRDPRWAQPQLQAGTPPLPREPVCF